MSHLLKTPTDKDFSTLSNSNVKHLFRVVCRGDIVRIDLSNQRLTNAALGDLSKLPSTLKHLNLIYNELTRFDIASLPTGLEQLLLQFNRLIELDLAKLPRQLIFLWLNYNQLISANLSALPHTLQLIDLSRNYLNDSQFGHLPGRSERNGSTGVVGRGNQRIRRAYAHDFSRIVLDDGS